MKRDEIVGDWYSNHYNTINASADSSSFAFNFMHRSLERNLNVSNFPRVLEIGANKGEHLKFVKHDYKDYILTDLKKPLGEFPLSNSIRPGVSYNYIECSAEELPFLQDEFDRVVITCVLHHLDFPWKALEEVRRVLKVEGTLSILLPHDPGIVYRFLRHFTTVRKARKLKLGKKLDLVHALEHRNHFLQISQLINEIFGNDEIYVKQYPLPIKSYNLNAFSVYSIRKRKKDV